MSNDPPLLLRKKSIRYPLSVFNKNSTLKGKKRNRKKVRKQAKVSRGLIGDQIGFLPSQEERTKESKKEMRINSNVRFPKERETERKKRIN